MGYAYGYIGGRDIGYGVPATCDYPSCKAVIDRGLSYACGDWPGSHDDYCGLFFCSKHMTYTEKDDSSGENHQCCDRCAWNIEHADEIENDYKLFKPSYDPKPDRNVWIRHKLKHHSWAEWRSENPEEVEELQQRLNQTKRRAEGSQNATDNREDIG
jgi:hypothetical protein